MQSVIFVVKTVTLTGIIEKEKPMPQDDPVTAAKKVLAGAQKAFPSSMAPKAPVPTVAPKTSGVAPVSRGEDIAAGLKARTDNVDSYKAAYPKMHKGGPVPADGTYDLKKGEHVLTEAEAKKARKHALMAAGMKSLAKPIAKPTPPMAQPVSKAQGGNQ